MCNGICDALGMEIPLFIYMLTSFLKYPVFQNLIYEKLCLIRYEDSNICSNVTAYYSDKLIQADANHFYLLSSIVLIIPSFFSTLLLGSVSDLWDVKMPLLIPFFGLIISTMNYIVQTVYMDAPIYLLLISDVIFGICGGYIALLATTLSYGVKKTTVSRRSVRIAGFEGAIGLGGTVGYALSGTIRELMGYSYTFLLLLILQISAFFYTFIFAKEYGRSQIEGEETNRGYLPMLFWKCITAFSEYRRLLTPARKFPIILGLNFFAFGLELFIFSGLMDIQYSYFRYKLGWGDKLYGWFSGLQFGVTTLTVFFLYPFLLFRGFTDGTLGCLVITSLNRFVSTGFRSFISSIIQTNEQGKMFSLIALLEGATALLATAVFNTLYPKTLSFFPGLLYAASSLLLIIPLVILGVSDRIVKSEVLQSDQSISGINSIE